VRNCQRKTRIQEFSTFTGMSALTGNPAFRSYTWTPAGPITSVFDAGVGGVPFLFRISVALLVALEIAGLWGAAHALVGLIRSNTSNRSCRRRLVQQANGNDSSCFRPAELEEKNPGEGNAGARRPAEGVNASRRIHGMSAF